MSTIRSLLRASFGSSRPYAGIINRLRPRSAPSNSPVNYHRQAIQFRQNSTSHRKRPIPSAWKSQNPLVSFFEWFSRSQSRRPYLTQLCVTPVIFCIGDFSAQMIGDGDDLDYYSSLRSIVIGSVIAIPTYKWFLFLGRSFNYNSFPLSLGAKVTANQAIYTPLFNIYFFASHGILAGDGIGGCIQRVEDKASISIPRSFSFWPFVTALNFTYVKPHYRSIVTAIFSAFWQTYLSWLNRSDVGENRKFEGESGGVMS